MNDLGSVLGIGKNDVCKVVMKVAVTDFAVVLGVGKLNLPWFLLMGVAEVVEVSLKDLVSKSSLSTFWATEMPVIPALLDNLRLGNIFGDPDPIIEIGDIFADGGHINLPSERSSKG